jgi:hypothetical protein
MRRREQCAWTREVASKKQSAAPFVGPLVFAAMARRTRTALLVLVLALLAPTALGGLFGSKKAAATANNGEVLVIDGTDSFSAAVKAHDFLVVEFYAPVRAAEPVRTHPPVGRHTRPGAGQAYTPPRRAVPCAQRTLHARRPRVSHMRWVHRVRSSTPRVFLRPGLVSNC